MQRAKLASRDLQTLKSAAAMVTRTLTEVRDLKSDISRLERDLESSGSLKTVEDVQREAEVVTNEMYAACASRKGVLLIETARTYKGIKLLCRLRRSSSRITCGTMGTIFRRRPCD